MSHSQAVASHYDKAPKREKSAFFRHRLVQLKKLNSWTKASLISTHVGDSKTVLEVAAGKGGDLPKYSRSARQLKTLVCADISSKSIEECQNRYRQHHQKKFNAQFINADCMRVDLRKELAPTMMFDMVSCQLAFHYCWERPSTARAMLHNISCRLRPGGYFIGTMPDYDVLRSHLDPGMTWGNEVVSIKYECFPAFGAQYRFRLVDAIDDCPEYLVNMDVLVSLAREYKLEFVRKANFQEYYDELMSSNHHAGVARRMKVPDKKTMIAEYADQWAAYGLYQIFVFRRVDGAVPPTQFLPHTREVKDGITYCHLTEQPKGTANQPNGVATSSSSSSSSGGGSGSYARTDSHRTNSVRYDPYARPKRQAFTQ